MVLKSLSKDFAGFRAAYNLGNKNPMFTLLMKELQSYELMLNGSQLVRREKANIDVAFSSKQNGKHVMKGKVKVFGPPQGERKRTRNPKDLSKSKCFLCSKKWHFKAN
ncbi:hypothetical protein PVK06_012244 [Gossypium arboreum]|uniref:Uncharacterized protein n=1 Tax=Gossypium arboreum TaxID=29729 RepID=A0ABR0QAU9_GOSAR|nr:hypothetical protein PVK06_012244 [Gossypium arboreum]